MEAYSEFVFGDAEPLSVALEVLSVVETLDDHRRARARHFH